MNIITTVTVAVIAFVVTSLLGIWLVPFLRKVKCGQTINDIGPTWHKKKQGTPTMGGFLFIIGILVAAVAGWFMLSLNGEAALGNMPALEARSNMQFFSGILLALAFGFIGFVDDYIKVVKKRNLGLDERQKLVMQIVVSVLYLISVYLSGDQSTGLRIPFLGTIELGLFYYPFALFLLVGVPNAVNLTDGLDGLCSSVTFMAALGLMVLCTLLGFGGMGVLATALAGGCLGFLVWNFYPAKIMMGDTGSMFLGGMLVAIAFGIGYPVVLALVGIVYMLETLSVIIQRTYYKLTHGKRIFKMTPIHHHFEMSGFSEIQIVLLFSVVTAVGAALAVWSAYRI